jgi:bla regulator protein blaR1
MLFSKVMNRLLVGVSGIAGFATLTAMILSGAPMRAQTTEDTVPEWQKAAGGKLSFEVASIKLADPTVKFTPNVILDVNDLFYGGANPHGRLVAQSSLRGYISFAYKLWASREQQDAMVVGAPKWVGADQYVINAEAQGNPTKDQMRLMMQALLADRFKLAVHFERRETQVLALVLDRPGKMGPKLSAHPDDVPCDVAKVTSDVFVLPCNIVQAVDRPNNSILMSGRNLTMFEIAKNLTPLWSSFAHPLVDHTGLEGRFDFALQWTRGSNNAGPLDPQGTTIEDALQDQLGLKLKPTKVLMDTLVIDSIERPTEN